MLDQLFEVEVSHTRGRILRDLAASYTEGAPLAWDLAPSTCHVGSDGTSPCEHYHQVWQYLNMLGIVTSTTNDTTFLVRHLRHLARRRNRLRILISGAADFALLAHLAAIQAAEGAHFDITVLDRCETPLAVNRWYAKRHRLPIETARQDILRFTSAAPFDVICSHNFVHHFDHLDKVRLIRAWRGLLKPGGQALTIIQTHAGRDRRAAEITSKADALAFRERALRGAIEHRDKIRLSPESVADAAFAFANAHRSYPSVNPDHVRDYFTLGGLAIDWLEALSEDEQRWYRPESPIRGKGPYLRIVAHAPH